MTKEVKEKTKNVLNQKEAYLLSNAIDARVTKISEGVCKYNDGWSDELVRQDLLALIPDLTIHNVAGARKKIFGNFPVERTEEQRLRSEVEALEFKVDGLNEKLKELQDSFQLYKDQTVSLTQYQTVVAGINMLIDRVKVLESQDFVTVATDTTATCEAANTTENIDLDASKLLPGEAPKVDFYAGQRLFNGGVSKVTQR